MVIENEFKPKAPDCEIEERFSQSKRNYISLSISPMLGMYVCYINAA